MLSLEKIFGQSEMAIPELWAEVPNLSDFESLRSAYTNGATWANDQNAAEITELQQENKRLALQNEILSGAYETSQKREKDLMAEKEELLVALIRAEHEIKHAYNGAPNFAVITKAKIRAAIEKSQGIFNPADLDEF